MDQQNPEIIAGDSSSVPLKRRRGRPRKYENVSSESGSPCTPRGSSPSIIRFQNTASQYGIQATPTQANLAAYSSLRPQSLPVQTNPSSSPIYGVQAEGVPAPTRRTSNFLHHSDIFPTQVNPSGTSSVRPTSLLGHAVSGTLDGTFDAGYLLTVRVPDTGIVLKGVVFDPQRSVPISRENDIAPFLQMATSNVISPSVLEQPSQTLVSVPIRPVSMISTAAVPLQMKEPATASQTDRQLPQKEAHHNQNQIALKVTEIGHVSPDSNANQESPSSAEVIKDARVDSLAIASVNKEKPQANLNLSAEGQSTSVLEPAGVGQTMSRIEEASINIAEASRKDAEMHETGTSTGGNMVEVPRGDVGQAESAGGDRSSQQVEKSVANAIETPEKDAETHEAETSTVENLEEVPGVAEGKIESVGGEQSVHQVEESSIRDAEMHQVPGGVEAKIESVEEEQRAQDVKESLVNTPDATGENAEMQQTETPSGDMVEVEGHHCPQEQLQSNSPKPSDQMTSDKGQFLGEQKLEDGETKLQDSSVLQEPTF